MNIEPGFSYLVISWSKEKYLFKTKWLETEIELLLEDALFYYSPSHSPNLSFVLNVYAISLLLFSR